VNCKIVDVTKHEKMLKKLYDFLDTLDTTIMPNFKRFKFFTSIGEAYAITNKDVVVGGLVMYSMPEQLVVLNYYIPESERNSLLSADTLNILLGFRDKHPKKHMYIKSLDTSAYSRFVTHIEDDIYRLNIPTRRMK